VNTNIQIDKDTKLAYIAKAFHKDRLLVEIVGLANARTLTLEYLE
jgi:hypothetical protein